MNGAPWHPSPLRFDDGWAGWAELEAAIWARFPYAGLVEAVGDFADDFAPARLVPAGRLWSRNGGVYDAVVAGYRARLRAGENIGPSWAFRFRGRLWVIDGNHKAAARAEEGQAAIPVRILDLG